MGQILHGCARTTAALRRTIRNSQESLITMAFRYHINAETVAEWRKRTSVKDAPMVPRRPPSTVLTNEQEAAAVAFRRRTLLPSGRLFVCTASEHSSFDSFGSASLPRTLRHQPLARSR